MPSRPPAHLIQGTSQLHQAFLETYHPAELIVAHSLGSARGTDGKWTAHVGNIIPYAARWIKGRDLALPLLLHAVYTALL